MYTYEKTVRTYVVRDPITGKYINTPVEYTAHFKDGILLDIRNEFNYAIKEGSETFDYAINKLKLMYDNKQKQYFKPIKN